jgi:hypothetical protein
LAGLALIFYAIFAFDKNTPYPSLYTLIPTIGTGLIIAFSNSNDLVGKLLGSKLLVGIGLISYSSYLWHHPLLAFARLRSINEPSIYLLGLLAVLSILFGYLSWKYIETPFKNKNSIPRNKIFIFSILASLLFVIIGFLGYLSNGFPARLNIPAEVSKSLIAEELKKENCGTNFNDKNFKAIELCSIGEVKKSNITLAIIGDSHVKAILPALDKIGKQKNERYIHMDKAGCPPFLNIDIIGNNVRDKSCRDLAIKQYNFITTHNIKNVLLISRWSMYTDGNYNNTVFYYLVSDEDYYPDKNTSRLNFKLSLKNTIKMYKQAGVNVFVLAQIPTQKFNASDVYNKIYLFKIKNKDHAISQLSVPKSQHLQLQSFSREVMNKLNDELKFTIINLDDAFCDEKKCYIGNGKYSKYKDYDHLSSSGSLTISNALNYQLKLLESSPSP